MFGKNRKYASDLLLDFIDEDPARASSIIHAVHPDDWGRKELKKICAKVWEKNPTAYADYMQGYLIDEINAKRDFAYCGSWLSSFVDHEPERASTIFHGIHRARLCLPELSELRDQLERLLPAAERSRNILDVFHDEATNIIYNRDFSLPNARSWFGRMRRRLWTHDEK